MLKKEIDIFSNMARPEIRNFEEYDPGEVPENCLKIHANENNMGVSPKALDAMTRALKKGNRYPESRSSSLCKKIASVYGLRPEQILTGNGLDGIFTMLGRAFLNSDDDVICGELTFSVYADTARIMGANPVFVPMTNKMALDITGHINAITEKTKMIFFCNPNNPTGTAASLDDIEKIIQAAPKTALFILDEAYIEFSGGLVESGFPLLKKYPNLVVCRTFSKIYGLAGLRLGWVAANPELLKYVFKVREPYCVTEVAAAGAEAALDDDAFVNKSLKTEIEERANLSAFFDDKGIKYIPSFANFILFFVNDAEAVHARLAKNGILIRILSFRGEKALRVTIGLPEENKLLMESLTKAINL